MDANVQGANSKDVLSNMSSATKPPSATAPAAVSQIVIPPPASQAEVDAAAQACFAMMHGELAAVEYEEWEGLAAAS